MIQRRVHMYLILGHESSSSNNDYYLSSVPFNGAWQIHVFENATINIVLQRSYMRFNILCVDIVLQRRIQRKHKLVLRWSNTVIRLTANLFVDQMQLMPGWLRDLLLAILYLISIVFIYGCFCCLYCSAAWIAAPLAVRLHFRPDAFNGAWALSPTFQRYQNKRIYALGLLAEWLR